MFRFCALCVICLIFPTVVSATTLDFRHVGASGWAAQAEFGGVTVRAGTEVDGFVQTGAAAVAALPHIGLGVRSSGDSGLWDLSSQIDSIGENDLVVFEFDRAVRLDRIAFSGTEWWDRFDLYVGSELAFDRTLKVDDFSGFDWVSTVGLGADISGTRFAIGASEYASCGYSISEGSSCWSEDSAFHITSITYSEIEPIPAPASLILMMSWFSMLGIVSRRRKKNIKQELKWSCVGGKFKAGRIASINPFRTRLSTNLD